MSVVREDTMTDDLICSLCTRKIPGNEYAEWHHLVPRAKYGKDKVLVCVDCGNQIHLLFANNELRDKYNTVEALMSDERVRKYVAWVRKRNGFGFCAKEKKRK